jgi:hypothetical protein
MVPRATRMWAEPGKSTQTPGEAASKAQAFWPLAAVCRVSNMRRDLRQIRQLRARRKSRPHWQTARRLLYPRAEERATAHGRIPEGRTTAMLAPRLHQVPRPATNACSSRGYSLFSTASLTSHGEQELSTGSTVPDLSYWRFAESFVFAKLMPWSSEVQRSLTIARFHGRDPSALTQPLARRC